MSDSTLAERYTNALIANLDNKTTDKVVSALGDASQAIMNNENVWATLQSPMTSEKDRLSILISAVEKFSKNKHLNNFFRVLIQKKRLHLLPQIQTTAKRALLNFHNTAETTILTASEVSETTQQKIVQELQLRSDKKLRVSFGIDADLIGGFKATIDNTVYDGSVQQSLRQFKARLSTKN
ncbi:ATP synthase F1 subunit delta [bacterium]|jgi:F-type H+-transporting ATPase subunit delta|nr:ATP synthase F1 subunit delta [bacterium]